MNDNDLVGAPERIRTSDPQIRSLVLYPAELRARMREIARGAKPLAEGERRFNPSASFQRDQAAFCRNASVSRHATLLSAASSTSGPTSSLVAPLARMRR